jgi:hypothetical protein
VVDPPAGLVAARPAAEDSPPLSSRGDRHAD